MDFLLLAAAAALLGSGVVWQTGLPIRRPIVRAPACLALARDKLIGRHTPDTARKERQLG